MPRDDAKRQRIADLLTAPATRDLGEREIARRAGASKGAVDIVRRLLRGLPPRRSLGRQRPDERAEDTSQDRSTLLPDPRRRAARLVRELLAVLAEVPAGTAGGRWPTVLGEMLRDLDAAVPTDGVPPAVGSKSTPRAEDIGGRQESPARPPAEHSDGEAGLFFSEQPLTPDRSIPVGRAVVTGVSSAGPARAKEGMEPAVANPSPLTDPAGSPATDAAGGPGHQPAANPATMAPGPLLSRDEAFARVDKLFRFLAGKLFQAVSDREECYQEAVVEFLSRFGQFDGNPYHLPQFARWMCLKAARRLRSREKIVGRHVVALPADDLCPGRADLAHPGERMERAEERQRTAAVAAAVMADLTPAARDVVTRLYGLDGAEPASLGELAAEKGCSKTNVSEIRRRAFVHLAEALAE